MLIADKDKFTEALRRETKAYINQCFTLWLRIICILTLLCYDNAGSSSFKTNVPLYIDQCKT